MRTVAKAARVSTSTVSRALRHDPTISVSRRAEIEALASRLGYRPHPLVAALMAQLHSWRRQSDPFHIAWIDFWTKANKEARGDDPRILLRGAQRRARELGYEIEVYSPAIDGISPRRLRQILITRLQWGVIFPPVPDPAMRYPLDMEGLSGVAIGNSLRAPVMHRVSHNQFQSGRLACEKLRAKGFQRIGFVFSPWADERIEHKLRAAYLLEQQQWPAVERLPPLLAGQDDKDAFDEWFCFYKPDAILAAEIYVGDWLRTKSGPPVRIAWLSLDWFKRDVWGIDYRTDKLGATAVELLIGQMHRNERGIPKTPQTVLIDGIWIER